MRKILAVVFLCSLVSPASNAGLFRNSIDLKDLADLSDEGIEALRETEYTYFVATVQLEKSKALEARARGSLKTAQETLEAEKLDLKASEAEVKAAKANNDTERAAMASAQIISARSDIATAQALVQWKQADLKARERMVRKAKAYLDQVQAERDLARVLRLTEEKAPSAAKYDIADIRADAEKRRATFLKDADEASRSAIKADEKRASYQVLAGLTPE